MAARPFLFELDARQLKQEIEAFAKFLGNDMTEISERSQILPFFKHHQHVASLVGYYHSRAFSADIIKSELGLFGDYACDLAVGNSELEEFCFIEFENAAADSVFKADGRWSPRLERGLSQITDWFYLLAGNQFTPQFRSYFHSDLADYSGLLVIGRSGFLSHPQKHRLRWRSQHSMLAGRHIRIITFDDLLQTLRAAATLVTSLKPGRK